MRRQYWIGLVMVSAGAVAAAGCSDAHPTGQPPLDAAAGAGGGGAVGSGGAAGAGASAGTGGGAAGGGGTFPDGGAGTTGTAGGGATGLAGSGGAAGASGMAGSGGAPGTGGAVGTGGGAPVLAPPTPVGLVALNSDFSSTSLSILSASGGLARGNCVHSMTVSGSSTSTISGDVVLPSQPQLGGDVVLVDRHNGELTFVDPTACTIARQVGVPGGATTNPHDVVIVGNSKAYVTRYQANLTATTAALMGNDVAIIDPTTGAFVSRINLDAYASTVTGATILARPDRALIADGKVVVSLNEIDASYVTYGEGKIVVIDPATDTLVASVTLKGLYDCEGMSYVAATKTLLVACGGPYGDEDQPLKSGIAVVDLGASPPSLSRTIAGVAFGDQPVNFGWVLAAPTSSGGTRAFAGTNDPNFVMPDALYVFDYLIGTTTQIATSDPYTIGFPASTGSLLFVPESTFTSPKIQLFNITGTPQATTGFSSDPTNGLPPQEVAWY